MADIYCLGCGSIFDARSISCPHCRRCCNCGTKQAEGAASCPSCGYPKDEASINEKELTLDPRLPANAREIRTIHRGLEREKLISQINFWKLCTLIVLATPISMFISLEVLKATGLNHRWAAGASGLFVVATYWLLVRFLEKGKLRWFLRK